MNRERFLTPRYLVRRVWLVSLLFCFAPISFADVNWTKTEVKIPVGDGLKLKGEVLLPKQAVANALQPAVVFLNPFGQSYSVYKAQAEAYAAQGYVVLRFNPRGWHGSEGNTTLDYTRVATDAKDAISWLLENYPVESGKIGVTGISEGAGTALLLAAQDPRLGAVAALSGWSDMLHPSLGQSQRGVWSGILLGFLVVFGNPLAMYRDFQEQLKNAPANTSYTAFQKKISPLYHLNEINRNGTPILISHNFDDTLFPVNQMFELYDALSGPRRLTIFPGFHAAGEITQITSQDKGPWGEVKLWFDRYLKGVGTRALEGVAVSIKNVNETLEESSTVPADTHIASYCGRGTDTGNVLASDVGQQGNPLHMSIKPWKGGRISTGIPVISALVNLRERQTVSINTHKIHEPEALLFESRPIETEQVIFGVPRVQLSFKTSSEKGMLIAHLLDIPPEGPAKLITHGVSSWFSKAPDGAVKIDIQALGVAWRLPAGHRLGLAFDGMDAEYIIPSIKPYVVDFSEDSRSICMQLPLIYR